MSATKHTPGPWRLDKRGNTYIVDKPGDGYITRDVCRMDSSTMSAFHQEGNAFLIAAAPDLLKELQVLRDWYEEVTGMTAKSANAAIAKATGQG